MVNEEAVVVVVVAVAVVVEVVVITISLVTLDLVIVVHLLIFHLAKEMESVVAQSLTATMTLSTFLTDFQLLFKIN